MLCTPPMTALKRRLSHSARWFLELSGSALLEDFDLEFDEPRAEESDDGDDAFDSDVELDVGCQWDSGSVDSYYLGSPVGNLSSRIYQRAAVALACE